MSVAVKQLSNGATVRISAEGAIYVRKDHSRIERHVVVRELGAAEHVGSIDRVSDGYRVMAYAHTYPERFATREDAIPYALGLFS